MIIVAMLIRYVQSDSLYNSQCTLLVANLDLASQKTGETDKTEQK